MLFSTTRAGICCAAIFAGVGIRAEENPFAAHAERSFVAAQESVRKEPTNVTTLVQLGHAAFDWAEFARDDDSRASIADAGIEAARTAIRQQPTNAAAHYWLAMDLGQLARTKSLGALKLVREMEEEFLRAQGLDEHVDYAGPDRSLGLLYRDAPGWPASIGSKKKAREHLERALQLHPEFPDNQLALLESLEEWDERQNFARQLKVAEKALAEAKEKFSGAAWEASWADWKKRLARLQEKSVQGGRGSGGKAVK